MLFKLMLLLTTVSVVTVGCRRQLEMDTNPADLQNATDRNFPDGILPPAYHIAQSEKLVIPEAIELPANLPAGNARVETYFAEGVQKYKAQRVAGSDPAIYEWVFVAPQADLYDRTNKKNRNTFGRT